MHQKEYSEFRERLASQARELAGALRDRESIAVESAPDDLDQLGLAIERERSAVALETRSRIFRQVREAMRRIETGTYGLCVDCQKEISLKRLRAVPWAERCVACQEKEDQNSNQFPEAA